MIPEVTTSLAVAFPFVIALSYLWGCDDLAVDGRKSVDVEVQGFLGRGERMGFGRGICVLLVVDLVEMILQTALFNYQYATITNMGKIS